jgi:Transglycosylase-like domain
MADDTTTAPPPSGGLLDDPTLQRLIQQFTPQPVQADQTPVARGWLSQLGEGIGGGKGPVPMSPADEETAGLRSLIGFGTGLMRASEYRPGATVWGNLARGFEGAQQSMLGSEELSASTLSAQQAYQQQQAQNRMEALKTALPLLQQQRMMNQPNPLAGGGGAAGGRPDLSAPWAGDPVAALPKDQALAAIVQRESGGKNIPTAILGPDGKPASTASGYYQMLDNTWKKAATLAGIKNPPARAMDASKADQDAAASALWDQQGYAPWAPSAPSAAPAPYKVATAGSAVPPPPSAPAAPPAGGPDIRTSPTLRGPGAPVPAAAPAAGAEPFAGNTMPPTPTTLPPTTPPTPQQASQQPTDTRKDVELTLPEFIQRHAQPPTFEPVPVAPGAHAAADQAVAAAAAAKQAAAQNLQDARAKGDTAGENKAVEAYRSAGADLTTALNNQNKLTQDAAAATATNKQKAGEDQNARLTQAYIALKAQQAEADRLTQTGKQAIDLENVKTGNTTSQKLLEAYNTDAQNSGKRIDDLELLRGLSDNAGTPTLLTNIKIGDRSLADIISATGFGGKDLQDKVGAVQAFRAGILNTVRELRSGGAATGEPRSNQDLQFVQDMAPNEWQNPATRGAIISFLQQVNQRRIDMAAEVSRLTATRGTNGQLMPAGEAIAQARKNLPDFVQTVPAEAMGNTPDQVQARKNWFATNVPPHTFFRYPNGRIDLYNGPGGQ